MYNCYSKVTCRLAIYFVCARKKYPASQLQGQFWLAAQCRHDRIASIMSNKYCGGGHPVSGCCRCQKKCVYLQLIYSMVIRDLHSHPFDEVTTHKLGFFENYLKEGLSIFVKTKTVVKG